MDRNMPMDPVNCNIMRHDVTSRGSQIKILWIRNENLRCMHNVVIRSPTPYIQSDRARLIRYDAIYIVRLQVL